MIKPLGFPIFSRKKSSLCIFKYLFFLGVNGYVGSVCKLLHRLHQLQQEELLMCVKISKIEPNSWEMLF